MARIQAINVAVANASAASVTTPAITTTSGNLLVAVLAVFSASFATPPITDSKGNTWTLISGASSTKLQFYYCENCTGGAGHTFTLTPGSSTSIALAVLEISGAISSSLGNVNVTAGGGNVLTSGNITSTHDDELWVGASTQSSGGQPSGVLPSLRFIGGAGSGTADLTTAVLWQAIASLPDGSPEGLLVGVSVVPSGVTSGFASLSVNGVSDVCGIAAFKGNPASAGGGGGGAWASA